MPDPVLNSVRSVHSVAIPISFLAQRVPRAMHIFTDRIFLFFGMPLGCFFFDFLMFLGPFGLLPVVPMPEAMRLFVPACEYTRVATTLFS